MRFETYAEAEAHARESNKVVRFRSPEWLALRQQTEAASPLVINAPRDSVPPRGEGEPLLEFVLRILSAYSLDGFESAVYRFLETCSGGTFSPESEFPI